jgi:hypothetical protein
MSEKPEVPIVSVPGPEACAPVSPEMFAAYLLARGWEEDDSSSNFRQFRKYDTWASVPLHTGFRDYARRVAQEIDHLAEVEGRPAYVILREIAVALEQR